MPKVYLVWTSPTPEQQATLDIVTLDADVAARRVQDLTSLILEPKYAWAEHRSLVEPPPSAHDVMTSIVTSDVTFKQLPASPEHSPFHVRARTFDGVLVDAIVSISAIERVVE